MDREIAPRRPANYLFQSLRQPAAKTITRRSMSFRRAAWMAAACLSTSPSLEHGFLSQAVLDLFATWDLFSPNLCPQ
jgi:hypothetical protein